ncbi:MAG: pilin [Candidatus Saccharimonadales bacterium]
MTRAKIISWLAAFVACMTLTLGLSAIPVAFAQTVQQQINNGLCAGSNLQFDNSTASCSSSNANTSINNIVHTIVNLLSAIVGIVAVIMIIVGGLRYITSGGNDTSVTSAKNTILYAIVGLIVVALAQIIVRFTLSKVTNS